MVDPISTTPEKIVIPLWRHGQGLIIEGVQKLDKLSNESELVESPQDEEGTISDLD